MQHAMSDSPTDRSSRRGTKTKRDGSQKFQEGDLCEACQRIDFESCFKLKVASQRGIPVRAFRGTPQNWAASACRLCRFFADVCLRNESCDQYHLRLFDSYRLLHPSSYHKAITKRPHSTVLGVVPGPATRKGKRFTNSFVTSLNLIAPLAEDTEMLKSPAIRARPVDIVTPNYKLIRSFLDDCLNSHDQKICARPADNLQEGGIHILLIDCHKLKVIDGNSGMQYFALSYTWGTPVVNVQELEASEQHRLLSSRQLPKTIDDAIEAVLKMGERFLWVDMLCITKSNKHAQLQQMHKIYEEALATLVAVEGNGVDHGIMGIRCRRPCKQAIVHTKGGNVASIAQSLSVVLHASKWSQRAWTFQETVLSRRCIFFTSAQIYFTCRSGTTCETLSGSGRLAFSLGSDLFERFDEFDHFALSQKQRNLLNFWKQLSIYMRRDLGFEKDALDAYMGVLSRCSYTTYWGVAMLFEPVTPLKQSNFVTGAYEQDVIPTEKSKCFGIGLLWLCANPHTPQTQFNSANKSRRVITKEVGFPSWAWASIRKYASCNPEPLMKPFSLNTRPFTTRGEAIRLADILVECGEGSLETVGHLLAKTVRKEAESVIPKQTEWLHISHDCLQIALRLVQTPSGNAEHFFVPPSHEPYGHCSSGYNFSGRVWLDADIMTNSNGGPDPRIEKDKWDAVQICCLPQRTSWWLLLDKRDDYYVRIGVMEISERAHQKSAAKACPCRKKRVIATFRVG